MNIRVVQGIFDDLNPETAARWVYPDTKRWDPDRNTNEFVATTLTVNKPANTLPNAMGSTTDWIDC